MSQDSDLVLGANLSGSAFRAELNLILNDLLTTCAGATVPTFKQAHMLWVDTAATPLNLLKYYDGTDSITLGEFDITNNLFHPAGVFYGADAGATDAYAFTAHPTAVAYYTGMAILFKANTLNTGACTVDVDSLGAISLKRLNGTDPETGDILANQWIFAVHDGTNFRIQSPLMPTVHVNAQTGTTYTYTTGDRNKLVTHTNAASIAGTLPQAGSGFEDGWFMWVQNRGAGTLTITPTTSTVDGAATLVLPTGTGVLISSDGTNYFTSRGAGVTAAVQADQETATSTTTYVSPGVQQYHPSAAKAWVYFVGTGTVTINKSYNISSVGDNGVGDYTINFTTAFSDANYCGVIGGYNTGSSDGSWNAFSSATTPTASLIRMVCFNSSGSAQDQTRAYAAFFGDQ